MYIVELKHLRSFQSKGEEWEFNSITFHNSLPADHVQGCCGAVSSGEVSFYTMGKTSNGTGEGGLLTLIGKNL